MLRKSIPLAFFLSLVASIAIADDVLDVKKVVRAFLDAEDKWDPKAFANYWTDDGKLVRGRIEQPEKSEKLEVVLDRKAIDDYWALSLADEAQTPRTYSDVKVTLDGDKATLRLKWRSQHTATEYVLSGQEFQLRRLSNGWRIYHSRIWPIEEKIGNTVLKFTAQSYKTWDTAADEALRKYQAALPVGGETLRDARAKAIITALEANRFKDMHEIYKEATKGSASASVWKQRGSFALSAGDPSDSMSAYQKAIELDPMAEVPKAVRGKITK